MDSHGYERNINLWMGAHEGTQFQHASCLWEDEKNQGSNVVLG